MTFTFDDTFTAFGDVTQSIFSSSVYQEFVKSNQSSVYDGSSTEKFHSLGPSKKSKQAAEWVADIIQSSCQKDIFVECEDRQRYIIIPSKQHGDLTMIVKTSCLWGNVPGTFRFQNIRRDRGCDAMSFVMVYPDEIRMFWAHRADVMNDFMMVAQHKGADFWFDLVDTNLPAYFHPMDQIAKLWD